MATTELPPPRGPVSERSELRELEDEDSRLRADSHGVETLLAQAEAQTPAAAWRLVEESIRRVVELYSRGLVRAIGHARAADVDGAAYDERLCGDELISSLLVLHGAHPRSCEDRIRAALAKLEAALGGVAQLAALGTDGVAYIRVGACDVPPEIAAEAIRRTVEQVAPELRKIAVRIEA